MNDKHNRYRMIPTENWEEEFDAMYEMFRGNKDMFRDFIEKVIEREKQLPYDVSEWARVGKERGYWQYFKKQVLKEASDFLLENGHGGGNWRRLATQLKDMGKPTPDDVDLG